jgi:putative ABC transport system permease protein
MKKTFFKNLIRDIGGSLSRFLSIVIIIAVGVAFYAGVRATSPDMKLSADSYLSKNNLMDFKLISALGLTNNDLTEVKNIKGVTAASGAYSVDAVIKKGQKSLVLNILSQPTENDINKVRMVSGRLAVKDNEAVVEQRFLDENDFKIGDKIVLQSGNDKNISDSIKNNEFVIVGSCESPLFVSVQRQLSSVGNGSVKGFVYILPGVFDLDVYTEIYVRTKDYLSENSMKDYDNYKINADIMEKNLKSLSLIQSEIRYKEVLKTADDKIKEAEDKLSNSKKEAEDKFSDARLKLTNAQKEIDAGYEKLKNNQNLFNEKISEGEAQISAGKSQIKSAETEISAKTKELESGWQQLEQGKKDLSSSENTLNDSKQQAADGLSSAVSSKIEELKVLVDSNPGNLEISAQYQSLNHIYINDIKGKDFDSMYDSLKKDKDGAIEQLKSFIDLESLKSTFDRSQSQINIGRSTLTETENMLKDGEKKLKEGKDALAANKKKITDAETELSKAKQQGLTELAAGNRKLAASQNTVNENLSKLKSEEASANDKFKDAQIEIQDNKDKLTDIKKPDWYILGRSANIGYETYRQDSDRIDNIGKAFPLIFFLVAALVSLTTMTRMVQEKRLEIGTFKALGYSREAIVAHFLIYSLSASLIGSLIGISIGFRLFPPLIMNAYTSLYTIPDRLTPFNNKLAFEASLLAVLFVVAASIASTLEESKEAPASLLRPKPPKSGKSILLERLPFIWKKFSFTEKVTARNIFRYKQRFFMTVIGIAACTGLMITGFGLKGAITGATENQFSTIYKYDMQSSLTKNIDDAEKATMKQKVLNDSNMKSVLFAYSKNSSVKNDSNLTQDAYLLVPENADKLNQYINLTLNNKKVNLPDNGVVITVKLSKLLHKKIGDTIEITVNDKVLKASISGIAEQYIQHYIYMSPAYYQKLTGEKPEFNNFYGLLQNTSESLEDNTAKTLTKISHVGSVSFKNRIQIDYGKSVKSINYVVLVLIISAGVLAFVVIYNLTDINMNERKSELATIKLLGFYNSELASYIYRENIILTIIGSITGIGFGILMDKYVISTAETNILTFYKRINPMYFLYSVLLTILFSLIVNLTMYKRFDKIDMIESLKSNE